MVAPHPTLILDADQALTAFLQFDERHPIAALLEDGDPIGTIRTTLRGMLRATDAELHRAIRNVLTFETIWIDRTDDLFTLAETYFAP